MHLYHYFDKTIGPFVIPIDEAKAVLNTIKTTRPNVQSAMRNDTYMNRRHVIEEILKTEFAKKGGLSEEKPLITW